MAAQRAMLVEAPALDRLLVAVAADRAADMVDDAEAGSSDDRRVRHVVRQAFGELLAFPHAVQPVRVAAVAAADVDGYRSLDSTSKWTGVPSGVVASMVAAVGMRVPER